MRTLSIHTLSSLALLAVLGCRGTDPDDTGTDAVDADADGSPATEDCNDADAAVHPGATEICNGIDDDCDADIDGGATDATTFYADGDGDGYGSSATVEACDAPSGYAAEGGDCDDSDPAYHPGASESDCADPADYNCDGSTGFADADGDGYAACEECDDTNASANPGATETCNGADDDCDGTTDEPDASGASTFYADADGDGYGDSADTQTACSAPSGYVSDATDCDDGDSGAYPGATETCDGVDDDCDGSVDEDASDRGTFYADSDGDGYGDPGSSQTACTQPSGYVTDKTDCDDASDAAHPGGTEVCGGGDEDCDGSTDEDDASDAKKWYGDSDGDNYGETSDTKTQCAQPAGYVEASGDCDDAKSAINPGAAEVCGGGDENCDGAVDEGTATDAKKWYADKDKDKYGNPDDSKSACTQPAGYIADDSDCHDDKATAFPGSTATEVPKDGIDTDCDGNDFCTDLNCDGLTDMVAAGYYNGSTHNAQTYLYFADRSGYNDTNKAAIESFGGRDVAVADLNGDGYQDVVIANYYHNSQGYNTDSHVYWGSKSGYNNSNRTALPTFGAMSVAIADLNQDGRKEIVFANYYHASQGYNTDSLVYWNSSTGFSTTNRTPLPTHGAYDVDIADLNDDGWPDLVFADYHDGDYNTNSYIYWGSSSGYKVSDRTTLPTEGPLDLWIEDLDGDGFEELIFPSYRAADGSGNNNKTFIYWGTSSGYGISKRTDLVAGGGYGVTVGDYNGDGFRDIVVACYHNGSTYIIPSFVFWGSDAGYSTGDRTSLNTGGGILYPHTADLNGDGNDDVIMPGHYQNQYSSQTPIYFGSSAGLSDSNKSVVQSYGAYRANAADLNGDGRYEVLIGNYHIGNWSTLPKQYVYRGTSSGYANTSRDELAAHAVLSKPYLVGRLAEWND